MHGPTNVKPVFYYQSSQNFSGFKTVFLLANGLNYLVILQLAFDQRM